MLGEAVVGRRARQRWRSWQRTDAASVVRRLRARGFGDPHSRPSLRGSWKASSRFRASCGSRNTLALPERPVATKSSGLLLLLTDAFVPLAMASAIPLVNGGRWAPGAPKGMVEDQRSGQAIPGSRTLKGARPVE